MAAGATATVSIPAADNSPISAGPTSSPDCARTSPPALFTRGPDVRPRHVGSRQLAIGEFAVLPAHDCTGSIRHRRPRRDDTALPGREFHIGCLPGQNFAYNRPRTFPTLPSHPSTRCRTRAGRSGEGRLRQYPAVGVGQRHLLGR